jgi:hypothetical protein
MIIGAKIKARVFLTEENYFYGEVTILGNGWITVVCENGVIESYPPQQIKRIEWMIDNKNRERR